ncbi:General stress protein 69 [Marinobacterium sp. xm-a-121]|jgi:aryl-alcohol dehydrogenase-like predicted oxidoreductase|uniref:aldo/keto reductase n=1 Tax=unclassified Marinobacterium TaxID=2644139 RepID=UPI0015680D66|nr:MULTISPECIES: aldo/keto reductase [unclassified Marinobacterium]NRP10284.1 General stress protein 69 [Marinobacterium sp. xm-g-48]NRP37175.1 General stress protein 69 [Marinobacterium sp. xm-d-579]NRP38231.1 General stress protein 69 [Marinobacterium sp. xm-a-121]NRP47014.1 General stress protein 69 [Marinobacterium sp. xm-d-543]NRP53152.1 General stress protein 69 [Marinobacterium sp. xm-v-242]
MSKLEMLRNNPIGLGCMNMSHAYNTPVSDDEAIKGFREAFEMGYRHFDTATLYGGGKNEKVVGEALKSVRDEIFLASKCVLYIDPEKGKALDGRPETIKAQCEASLKRLQTDQIDLYYLHRRDFDVPIEESAGAMADLIKEGKIASYGLSEMSADTLRAAHKECPVAAIQTEYSLWTRNPEIAVLDACRELDVTFVAFSPLARGFLSLTIDNLDELAEKDIRRAMPRFYPENFEQNRALLSDYVAIAERAGCTPAQLALAWIRAKDPSIVSIPGTRFVEHMRDNLGAADVTLSSDIVNELEQLINRDTVAGERYSAGQQTEIDTEEFA